MLRNRTWLVQTLVTVIIAAIVALAVTSYTTARAAGAAAGTSSTLDEVIARGTLRCGIPISGLPVAAKDASGNIIGFVPEMCDEMAKGLAVKLEIVDTPAPDRIPYILANKIDLSIGTVTLERAKAISFGGIWAVDGTAAAVLKSSGITSYDQVKGKKIAVVTGTTGDLVSTKRYPDNTFQRVEGVSTAIQAVKAGQADIVFDDFSALSVAAKDDPNLLVLDPLTHEPSGIMLRQGDQKWINWVNYFLDDFYGSGVSTCGCGKDKLLTWFGSNKVPLLFDY